MAARKEHKDKSSSVASKSNSKLRAVKARNTVSVKPSAIQAYLTKRILETEARKAFIKAAEETMEVMGYNLVAKNGWLVKIYEDGHSEKISKLETVPRPPSGKIFD